MEIATTFWLVLMALIGLLAGIKSLFPTILSSSDRSRKEFDSLRVNQWLLASFFFLWGALLGVGLLYFFYY